MLLILRTRHTFRTALTDEAPNRGCEIATQTSWHIGGPAELYFSPRDPGWAKQHLDAERKFGIEMHSIEADPLFVDVEHGNFRLKKESPAFKLGIEPIAFDKIGLRPHHPFHQAGR